MNEIRGIFRGKETVLQIGDHLTIAGLCLRWRGAKENGLHPGTLCNWRINGTGPEHIKIGRTILYPIAKVEEYERKMTKRSTVG